MPRDSKHLSEIPWGQSRGENSRVFAMCKVFLELGRGRTLRQAADQLHVSIRQLQSLSGKWGWFERARLYDAHLDEIELEGRRELDTVEASKWQERRKTLREREWEIAEQLIRKAQQMLMFPLIKQEFSLDGKTIINNPAKWSLRDAAALLDLASKLSRLSAELETDRTKIDIEAARTKLAEMLGVAPHMIPQDLENQQHMVS